ncbi:MAG: tetratricopeptide repeat protein, partial [Promethearchaeota archaeon]
MPNQTNDKIVHAHELKDQCKYKEAHEILSSIENVNKLTVDDQISFYLLQSFLFYELSQFNKALDAADWVFQKSIKSGNDLAMLDSSLARGKALIISGKAEECYNSILKCEELISRIKDQPEKIIGYRKAVLSFLRSWYYEQIGNFDKFLEYSKINLALSEKYGTKRDIAGAFYTIGSYYNETGDFAKGLENFEKSLKISKEINYKMNIAKIVLRKGWYYYTIGRFDKFLECSKKFLVLSKKYGTKRDIAFALRTMGEYYHVTGDFTKALENYENSLKIEKEINDKLGIAYTYIDIGDIYRNQGELDRALEYYNQGLSLVEKMGYKVLIADILEYIGLTHYEKGELDKGLNRLKKSLQLKKERGNNFKISKGLFYIIPMYLDQNDIESAQICLEELRKIKDIEENKRIKSRYLIAKALILKKTGGTRNIIRAEDILNKLLEEKSVENDFLVIIFLNLCELLYKELQITNEIKILEDITPLITKLLEISEKMH